MLCGEHQTPTVCCRIKRRDIYGLLKTGLEVDGLEAGLVSQQRCEGLSSYFPTVISGELTFHLRAQDRRVARWLLQLQALQPHSKAESRDTASRSSEEELSQLSLSFSLSPLLSLS